MSKSLNHAAACLALAIKGNSTLDKLRLLTATVLDSIPTRVKKRIKIIPKLADIAVAGTEVEIDNVAYVLVDSQCFEVFVSSDHATVLPYLLSELREEDVFVDVGSHIGRYALPVAKRFSKSIVIAVEPHPVNCEAIIQGIKLNKLKNVILLNMAAWKENSIVKLFVHGKSAAHSLIKGEGEHIGVVSVPAVKLDDKLRDLGIEKVTIIKIDVEGADLEVLQGLKETLKKSHPSIIFEWYNHSPEIRSLLKDAGYSIKLMEPEGNYLASRKLEEKRNKA